MWSHILIGIERMKIITHFQDDLFSIKIYIKDIEYTEYPDPGIYNGEATNATALFNLQH